MIVNSVLNMMNRFGSPAIYHSRNGSFSDTTLKKTASETLHNITMQVSQFRRGFMPSMAQDGDLEGRIAASGLAFTPIKNDKITWNGRVLTVVNVDPMLLGGEAAVFILVLRGV